MSQEMIHYLISHLGENHPFILGVGKVRLLICTPHYHPDSVIIKRMQAAGISPADDTHCAVYTIHHDAIEFSSASDSSQVGDAPSWMNAEINDALEMIFRLIHPLPLMPKIFLGRLSEDDSASQSAYHCAYFSYEALMPALKTRVAAAPYRIAQTDLPLIGGQGRLELYGGEQGFGFSAALLIGIPETSDDAVLLRLHSQCFTGDIFGSRRCDCGYQLHYALELMHQHGQGMVLYLPQEGRNIGLPAKLHAYELQDRAGLDTVDANLKLGLPVDNRDFSFAVAILKQYGIKKVKLLTHNPRKAEILQESAIDVVEIITMPHGKHDDNSDYILTKQKRLNHFIPES